MYVLVWSLLSGEGHISINTTLLQFVILPPSYSFEVKITANFSCHSKASQVVLISKFDSMCCSSAVSSVDTILYTMEPLLKRTPSKLDTCPERKDTNSWQQAP